MPNDLRAQISSSLISKSTEELLQIWENGDLTEWDEEVFEIVKEILLERLGQVPPRSTHMQVLQILGMVDKYLENDELDKALIECERAIRMEPDFAIAHNYLGEIHEEMGQLENAIADYRMAIRLDPGSKEAWANMLIVEKGIERQFRESATKQHIDQALEFAYQDETERALEECELAKQAMPGVASAHNHLGTVLEKLGQLEPAIDSYLKAIQLNPRFYVARENLIRASLRLEEQQFHLVAMRDQTELPEGETGMESDETQDMEVPEDALSIPQWLYMDEKDFLLIGWPGHRTRQGRSGYDPLETDFEWAHMQGVIVRSLISRKFRTKTQSICF